MKVSELKGLRTTRSQTGSNFTTRNTKRISGKHLNTLSSHEFLPSFSQALNQDDSIGSKPVQSHRHQKTETDIVFQDRV